MSTAGAAAPHVYVVVVNWRGWQDTVECLESVLRSRYPAFRVIVCDNASPDDSVARIRAWASGREPFVPPATPLRRLVDPPLGKPVPVLSLRQEESEAPGAPAATAPLVLIEARANLGFAGGCNVGIRYALRQPDCWFVWLLNNDCAVEPEAMGALVRRLQEEPGAGQCGSRLVYYEEPGVVQAHAGVRYNRWLAAGSNVGGGEPADREPDVRAVERALAWITGASLCVTRRFVEEVGLMEESYFLYYEELDWAARADGRFRMTYAHDSVVYHKEGRQVGSGTGSTRSALADYYQLRNRLRYAWKHDRVALPTIALGMLVAAVNRLRRGQPAQALVALRLLLDPRTYRAGGGGPMPQRRG